MPRQKRAQIGGLATQALRKARLDRDIFAAEWDTARYTAARK
jgi:hypothetical protein